MERSRNEALAENRRSKEQNFDLSRKAADLEVKLAVATSRNSESLKVITESSETIAKLQEQLADENRNKGTGNWRATSDDAGDSRWEAELAAQDEKHRRERARAKEEARSLKAKLDKVTHQLAEAKVTISDLNMEMESGGYSETRSETDRAGRWRFFF